MRVIRLVSQVILNRFGVALYLTPSAKYCCIFIRPTWIHALLDVMPINDPLRVTHNECSSVRQTSNLIGSGPPLRIGQEQTFVADRRHTPFDLYY